MRVISGKYRGRRLFSPEGDLVRPTTDRIKETIFNVLQFRVQDAVCLDLFAGSGALGIECLSRGAKEVVFGDKSPQSIDLVKRNLQGIEGNYRVIAGDFLSVLGGLNTKFDLVFIDPPYKSNLGGIAVEYVINKGLLRDDGVIVLLDLFIFICFSSVFLFFFFTGKPDFHIFLPVSIRA